ncbi:hypothetical protein [Streptomyces sp. NBC_01803]|uniref:hypothetical protein n=1 Tax=Streptomyces sp. NBC_01803 TaxID=2975946 RepID=UPI002DD93EAC|nr:hypothetical protein [Streptomyces sp. NBC_01803]WSA46363.1 hypothetical protein OIE51_20540 [Streptomyces sp. NBC_01803]
MIEQGLRRTVDIHFTVDEIRAVARGSRRHSVQSASDLNFGNYHFLLKEPSHWARLRWDVDQEQFLDWLEECRSFRNNLMHFSPDPLTEEQLSPVTELLGLLRTLDPHA